MGAKAGTRWMGPAVLAVLLLTACDLDFTDPFPGEPLRLSTHVDFHRFAEDEVRVTARLHPGRTADGRTRVIDHDTVEALGVRLGPADLRSDGTRTYGESWSLNPGAGAPPLVVRPPRPSSVADPPADLPFGSCRQTGPDSLVVSPGDTLGLSVSCDHTLREPTQSIWLLQARRSDTGGLILDLQSTNPAPPVIQLPTAWIHEKGEPELEITVRVTDLYGWASPTGDYRIGLDTSWSFRWRVGWEEGNGTRQPVRDASERMPRKSATTTRTTKR